MIDKAHIIEEIRRTAAENGGRALGSARFQKEAGISKSDWLGRYRARWSDALAEAGLQANAKTLAYDEGYLLGHLAAFTNELGRVPVYAEFRIKARQDRNFPSHSVWTNLGSKPEIALKLIEYCVAHPEYHRIVGNCRVAAPKLGSSDVPVSSTLEQNQQIGYVYLLKFRSDYKIGASNDPDRRYGEVATQMPDDMIKVHTIKTDDPFGVEKYWHQRFSEKRLKGEWFCLSLADIRAFKRWKTIL